MDALEFIKKRNKMCGSMVHCVGCPAFTHNCQCDLGCASQLSAEEQVAIVEKWSVDDIKRAPTLGVAPVQHARWERVIPSKSAAKWSTRVSCSNCHSAGYAHHKYCPNCGAKMDGELNE